ncbi:MAG: hypothetical protein CL897_02385 [Dehalococcoidia bacterium]|nr:hypothetical protein [Dehalococcoidia bacterium]
MADETPTKPVSQPDELTEPFFAAGEEGRLLLATCVVCKEMRLPTSPTCPNCLGEGYEWNQVSGRGKVYTFGIMHQRYHPAWEPELPYNIAVVELEEGPRMPANIIGVENDEISVGMPVEVVWELEGEIPVPRFRPLA